MENGFSIDASAPAVFARFSICGLAESIMTGIFFARLPLFKNLHISSAWNRTSENISGIKKDFVIGRKLLEIFPEVKHQQSLMSAIERAMQGIVCFVPTKAGAFNRHFYENHFIPLKDAGDTILGVMNIMHDVSHRIKAERQLEELNSELQKKYQELETANAELSTFTTITGNDLKEPIEKIYVALEFIIKNDGANLSNPSKANLHRIQSSINRINLLLDDILKMCTISSFSQNFTAVDLNIVLTEVLHAMEDKIAEKNAKITSDNLPTINGSKQMIYYLFYNLLSNSIKFQSVANTPEIAVISKPASQEEKFCVVIFSDNGIRFEESDTKRIFKLFEKLNPPRSFQGSGVGLTICRKIIESHGGRIEVESSPGTGSSFQCYFPKSI